MELTVMQLLFFLKQKVRSPFPFSKRNADRISQKTSNFIDFPTIIQQKSFFASDKYGTVCRFKISQFAEEYNKQQKMGEKLSQPAATGQMNSVVTTAQHLERIQDLLAKNQKLCCQERRFQTDSEPFNKFYEKWDGTQNQMHQKPMEKFVRLISEKYKKENKPMSIVDIGCGYGKQAYNMKKKLEAEGVQIQKFYGYDISGELIEIANQKYGKEANMKFFKKNLDTEFKDVAQFDAIVSFCAIHWVNNIKTVAESIARSLKPKGLLLALIGIDIEDFHNLRVKFINTSKWAQCFNEKQRKVSHFYYEKQVYLQNFQKYFNTLFEQEHVTPYKMNHEECIDFMGNWIQEVRHIITDIKDEPRRQAIVRAYTSDLIDSFPLGLTQNVIKNKDGTVIYKQHLLQYEGTKNC